MAEELAEHDTSRSLPGFPVSVLTILLPVLLMLVGSWADSLTAKGSVMNERFGWPETTTWR